MGAHKHVSPAVSPVAIVGMHRTGTSMVTKVLHDAGLHLVGSDADELLDAAHDNPEGFWENKAVVALDDDLLEAAGGSWDNPPDLVPQAVDDPRVSHLAERASEVLAGLRTHEHWGFKDPRACLTARFWLDLQPDLRFVVCMRNPLEVAMSLKRRNQNSYSLALELWERYYRELLDAVAPERRIVTHYDAFFLDPVGETDRLCRFAGLDPIRPEVRSDLRHHTIDVSLAEAGLSPSLRALYAELAAEAGLPVAPEPAVDEGKVRRMVLDGLEARRLADLRLDHIKVLESQRADDSARIRELEQSWANTFESLVRRAVGKAASVGRARGRDAVGRPTRELIADTRAGAVPAAKAAAGRLPPPAREALRKGVDTALAARARSRPALEALRQRVVEAAERGTPIAEWKDGYATLLGTHVAPGRRWLAVRPGSPAAARRLGPSPATPFPGAHGGPAPTDEQGLIAHLEALRYEGHERLVVPEGSRAWYEAHPLLRDHLTGRYRLLADEPLAGLVFDLTAAPNEASRTLLSAVSSLTRELPGGAAVLDWTSGGVARELPGVATFRPRPGPTLPYLDASVDVVVIDRGRDLAEARRVAALGVVTIDWADRGEGVGGVEVAAVERRGAGGTATGRPSPPVVTVLAPPGDDRWRAAIEEVVADAGRTVTVDWDALTTGSAPDGEPEVVVVLEDGVVPLPGAVEAAAQLAAAAPDVAVTGKVIGAAGHLAAAGGTTFADRSTGLVGAGSLEVRAPWHELVRPVCWPAGLVAASRSLWDALAGTAPIEAGDVRGGLREWGAAAWEAGHDVRYHPAVVAVQVRGDAAEPAEPWAESRWQRVLDLRPPRPPVLDDAAWRAVVAADDVTAARG